jgi:NTE family protein
VAPDAGASRPAEPPETDRADGVFEGGGVKGLAFAGAIAAAADETGVRSWVNVAGTSAGSIVAALLVAGFDAQGLREVLEHTEYRRFADYGFGGRWIGGLRNALRSRGIARGEYFREWLGERLAESELRNSDATFADIARRDLPADLPEAQREKARYRLRVIASDVTAGRMMVLPDDLGEYSETPDGPPIEVGAFKLADAVRMSMSFPFFFNPVTLYRDGRPHLIVDGGVLSNFPVWLFDSPDPIKRRTWGFRLHQGEGPEAPPYHEVPRPLWPIPLAKAIFASTTEAWDQRMSEATTVRTVSIPTGSVKTLNFDLGPEDRDYLYRSGYETAREFFRAEPEYMNSYGRRG